MAISWRFTYLDGPMTGGRACSHPWDALRHSEGPMIVMQGQHSPANGNGMTHTVIGCHDGSQLLRRFAKDKAIEVLALWQPPETLREYLEGDADEYKPSIRDEVKFAAAHGSTYWYRSAAFAAFGAMDVRPDRAAWVSAWKATFAMAGFAARNETTSDGATRTVLQIQHAAWNGARETFDERVQLLFSEEIEQLYR